MHITVPVFSLPLFRKYNGICWLVIIRNAFFTLFSKLVHVRITCSILITLMWPNVSFVCMVDVGRFLFLKPKLWSFAVYKRPWTQLISTMLKNSTTYARRFNISVFPIQSLSLFSYFVFHSTCTTFFLILMSLYNFFTRTRWRK